MKTIQYLFFGAMATLLMAADCSNKDSEFYNDVFISVPSLVNIEEGDNIFSVGDPVIVSSSFSKIVSEQGQETDVDLFRTTGGARSFTFSYLIERQNGGQWETANIDESNVVNDLGNSSSFGDFVLAQAIFDTELQSYDYRGGVVMTSAGDYRLRFTYNNSVSSTLVLTSDSFSNNLFVNIYSTCDDIDDTGYYYFTVN
jgi:hypothetical protein